MMPLITMCHISMSWSKVLKMLSDEMWQDVLRKVRQSVNEPSCRREHQVSRYCCMFSIRDSRCKPKSCMFNKPCINSQSTDWLNCLSTVRRPQRFDKDPFLCVDTARESRQLTVLLTNKQHMRSSEYSQLRICVYVNNQERTLSESTWKRRNPLIQFRRSQTNILLYQFSCFCQL